MTYVKAVLVQHTMVELSMNEMNIPSKEIHNIIDNCLVDLDCNVYEICNAIDCIFYGKDCYTINIPTIQDLIKW